MPYIRLPLGIKVAVEFTWNGEEVLNIHHVVLDSAPTPTRLGEVAQIVAGWAVGNLMPVLSSELEFTGVTATDLNVANGEQHYEPQSPPVAGDVGGDSVPNNVASVCTFYTPQTGRSFRGRAYVPGMAELYVAQNNLDSLVAAEVALTYAQLQLSLALVGGELVVASFQSGGAPRAEGIGTKVTSFSVNERVDTQRRRLPKA